MSVSVAVSVALSAAVSVAVSMAVAVAGMRAADLRPCGLFLFLPICLPHRRYTTQGACYAAVRGPIQ